MNTPNQQTAANWRDLYQEARWVVA